MIGMNRVFTSWKIQASKPVYEKYLGILLWIMWTLKWAYVS